MDDIPIGDAGSKLEELVARARRGEDVRITAPGGGAVRLVPVEVSTTPVRRLGLLEGILAPPPDDFFDPLSDDELRLWYGDED